MIKKDGNKKYLLNKYTPTNHFIMSGLKLNELYKDKSLNVIREAKRTLDDFDSYFNTNESKPIMLKKSANCNNNFIDENALSINNTALNINNFKTVMGVKRDYGRFLPNKNMLQFLNYEFDDAELIINILDKLKVKKSIKAQEFNKKHFYKPDTENIGKFFFMPFKKIANFKSPNINKSDTLKTNNTINYKSTYGNLTTHYTTQTNKLYKSKPTVQNINKARLDKSNFNERFKQQFTKIENIKKINQSSRKKTYVNVELLKHKSEKSIANVPPSLPHLTKVKSGNILRSFYKVFSLEEQKAKILLNNQRKSTNNLTLNYIYNHNHN